MASPQWGADNSGLARVPVFTLKQYRTNKSSTADMSVEEGDIFAGTFGRGAFQTTSLMTTRPIGIAEQEVEQANEAVKLFPNPAEDFTTLALELPAGNYTVELIDLNGRSVKSVIFEATEMALKRLNLT